MPAISKSSTLQRRSAERRMEEERILVIAETVFKDKGYPSATMDEIASAAGVAMGTLYNYFKTKDVLYAKVVEKIAAQTLYTLSSDILPVEDPVEALDRLVRFRVADFGGHMLFFVLFSLERAAGAYPEPGSLSDGLEPSYHRYLDILGRIFEKGVRKGVWEPGSPLLMALTFEGAVNAFMGYLRRPGPHDKSEVDFKEHIASLLRRKSPDSGAGYDAAARNKRRSPRMTRFDFERLKELTKVTRLFGKPDMVRHVEALDRELSQGGVIVDSKDIPPDVATMNSRVLLKNLASGTLLERTLVFPVDAEKSPDNLSILDPLGTALFGQVEGAVFHCPAEAEGGSYSLEKILYQPESSGDYHL